MHIFKVLRIILVIVSFIPLVFSFLSSDVLFLKVEWKRKNKKDFLTQESGEHKNHDDVQEAFSSFAFFVIFILISILFYYFYKNPERARIIFIPLLFYLLISIGQSIPVIKNLFKTDHNNEFSLRESKVMMAIALFIILLDVCGFTQRLIESILSCEKPICHDLLISVVYSGLLILYMFLIVIIGSGMLELILGMFKWAFNKIPGKEKIKKFHESLIERADVSNVNYRPISPQLWSKTKKWIKVFRFIVAIPLFLIAIIDTFIRVLEILVKVFPYLGCLFFELCNLIKCGLSWTSNFLMSLSRKNVLRIAIRVALVVAFLCFVVTNRYQPLFLLYEESTAIYEFVASVIIIPVIIDGIASLQEKKKESSTNDL